MPVVRRTAQAEDDLLDIWIYIAHDDPDGADRLSDEINHKCELLAGNPELGRAPPDIAAELRHLPVGSYLILDRRARNGIVVVRIVHGARSLERLL